MILISKHIPWELYLKGYVFNHKVDVGKVYVVKKTYYKTDTLRVLIISQSTLQGQAEVFSKDRYLVSRRIYCINYGQFTYMIAKKKVCRLKWSYIILTTIQLMEVARTKE